MTIVFDEIVAVVNAPGFERRFWDAGRWYEALTTLREAYVAAGADTTAVDAALSACDGASADICRDEAEPILEGNEQMEALMIGIVESARRLADDVGDAIRGSNGEVDDPHALFLDSPWYTPLRESVRAFADYATGGAITESEMYPPEWEWDESTGQWIATAPPPD